MFLRSRPFSHGGGYGDWHFVLVGVNRVGLSYPHQTRFAALPTKDRCIMAVLDREMATFQANLPALLEKEESRYVLIHGDLVASVWDTNAEALEEGYRRFLLEPFLVQHIVADEKPIFVPRELA